MVLAAVLLCLAPTVSLADLAPYGQDFEGLLDTYSDPGQVALADDGWLVFVNVFGPDWAYWYGYGTFPAPNGGFGGPAFCAVIPGQGGPAQGEKQLDVYSDYNNTNHRDGSNAIIETNVFREQSVGAADIGSTWRFEFDAKRGSIAAGSYAAAFFKTLDPASGFALTNYIPVDMSNIPGTWARYSLSFYIDPSLEGQLLQFGFLNQASNSAGTGIFYDNIAFGPAPLDVSLDIRPGGCPNPLNARTEGLVPAAVLGTVNLDVNDIDIASLRLEGLAPFLTGYEDVATPFGGEACGCTADGPDGYFDLTLKFRAQDLVDAVGLPQVGERILTLTGTLLDGTPIQGVDCVVFVGGGSRPLLHNEASESVASGATELQQPPTATSPTMRPQGTPEKREVRKPASR